MSGAIGARIANLEKDSLHDRAWVDAVSSAGVSIVVPAFKVERFLADALESIRRQSVDYWEAIVVDDGSPDASGEIAEEFAARDERIRVVHKSNGGLAESRNAGLELSNSRFSHALFLDGDDMLEPEALDYLSEVLTEKPEAPAAHGVVLAVDETGAPLPAALSRRNERVGVEGGRLRSVQDFEPASRAMLVVENCIQSAGAVLVRKTALRSAGPWKQEFAGVADWDMWFRLSALGDLPRTQRTVLRYRLRAGSMSRAGASMRRASRQMRSSWLCEKDPETRKLVAIGYSLMVKLYARRQGVHWFKLWRRADWRRVVLEAPRTFFCLAKAAPGIATMYLLALQWKRLGKG